MVGHRKIGLCDMIKRARSDEEVGALLIQGTYFENASGITRRRWARLAERRNKQLAADNRRFQNSWEKESAKGFREATMIDRRRGL